jgi:hypothetical protein
VIAYSDIHQALTEVLKAFQRRSPLPNPERRTQHSEQGVYRHARLRMEEIEECQDCLRKKLGLKLESAKGDSESDYWRQAPALRA